MPLVEPNWNPNQEEGRQNMRDYQMLMVRGTKKSVPHGNNMKLAFDGSQKKR